jgi:di/tricarboxylate transporter
MNPWEARDSVNLSVVLTIAASFGLGTAIAKSGLAQVISDGTIAATGRFGGVALLLVILLVTIALTELLSNNAAAAMMFPIAITAAASLGLDPRPFAIVVAIGASTGFLTPIGYQTSLVVWGVGGYRFSDFARVGWTMTLTSIAVVTLAASMTGVLGAF